MRFHPAADLFPLLDETSVAFTELVEDIRDNGLLNPIELLEEQILDGRNRYRACQQAGVEPRFARWRGADPYHHVISRNLHRRHLTDDQRAAIAMSAEPLLAQEAKRRQARHDGSVEANSPQLKVQPNATRNKLAEEFGVKPSKIKQAKVVAKEPALLKEVEVGKTTLRAAERAVRTRPPRNNGIDPSSLLPGQWIQKRRAKPPVTLRTRLIEAVNRGLGLPDLADELRDSDPELDDQTLRALVERLETEARARLKLSKALKAVLAGRT